MRKDKLRAKWSKKENDVLIFYPRRPDGSFLTDRLNTKRVESGFVKDVEKSKILSKKDWNSQLCFYEGMSFVEALEARGYDLTTLKFEIQLKKEVADKYEHLKEKI